MIGIYIAINMVNNKVYIGQSWDIEKRFKRHKIFQPNSHFRNSVEKYGISSFEFHILESIDENNDKDLIQNKLNELEQKYIIEYKSYDKHYGYNKRMGGGFGGKPTQETKDKIGNNKDRNRKISESRKNKSYEEIYGENAEKMKMLLTRNCHTKEANKKISEATKGVKKEIVKCPYCDKFGGLQQMKQFHFEHCKMNPSKKFESECPYCKKLCYTDSMKRWHFDNCLKNPKNKRELIICPCCKKEGYNISLMKRYHFDNCKVREDYEKNK